MYCLDIFLLSGVFLLLSVPSCSWAQVGLQMASPRAHRNYQYNNNTHNNTHNPGQPPFSSRWSKSDSLESSLAAIFRGVAYGISTTQPSSTSSSTSTTTTTTPQPPPPPPTEYLAPQDMPQDDYGYQASRPSFLFPESNFEPEIQQKAVMDQRVVKAMENRPIQTPYMEDPVNVVPEDVVHQSHVFGMTSERPYEEEGLKVELGVGLRKVAWVNSLGTLWLVHVYCAAGLYSILALLALFWLARLQVATNLLPRTYCIILYLLMFLAAFLRCIHLFHDPYGIERRLPVMMSAMAEETGWPCLTAALVVVILAIERAWHCSLLMFRRLQAPLALVLLTTAHLLVAATGHVISWLLPEHAVPILAAARAVTTAWGGVVGVGGFVSIWWVIRTAGRHPELLIGRLSQSSLEDSLSHRRPRMALYHGSHLVQVASVLQIVMACLHMYALVGPHYMFKLPPVYPWHWLAYQSACHLLEAIMWLLLGVASVLTVSRSSKKNPNGNDRKLFSIFCKKCNSCSSLQAQDKVEEVFPTICQRNQAVRNFTLQCYGKGGVYQEALMHEPSSPCHANTVRISHKRSSLQKSATLRSANSDIHLLWDHSRKWSAANGSDTSCRLSSMLFSDTGFACFRMQTEPKQDLEEVFLKTLPNCDDKVDTGDLGIQQQVPKDNIHVYDQKICLSDSEQDTNLPPAAKPIQVHAHPNDYNNRHHLQRLPLDNLYSDMCHERYTNSPCRNETGDKKSYTTVASQSQPHDNECFKDTSTCSSTSAANSFDIHIYNEPDVPSCRSPASPQGSSCSYVSYQRPVYDEGNFVPHDFKTRQVREHLGKFLAPNTTPTSPKADIYLNNLDDGLQLDLSSMGKMQDCHNTPHFNMEALSPEGWQQADIRHFNRHNDMPSNTGVENHTKNSMVDYRTPASMHHIHQTPLSYPSLSPHTAKNYLSSNKSGHQIINKDDACFIPLECQQLDIKQTQQEAYYKQTFPRDRRERRQSHGYYPSRNPREDTVRVTSRVNIPACLPRQPQVEGRHLSPDRDGQDWRANLNSTANAALRVTSMNLHDWPSPASSRLTSSYASNSDLPSECVDSEDEAHERNMYQELPPISCDVQKLSELDT